ncbi:uncharacterized protein CDAR_113261 [Caerostris darwini]|uniref:Uncharacterized protein n=1 Tax=Caerostris darwini TaxID=1538125 RepID=A0AAV4Q1R8_9ARAC|nr:uncharacterized protein CDAR_113261 [Caerostris darwini]
MLRNNDTEPTAIQQSSLTEVGRITVLSPYGYLFARIRRLPNSYEEPEDDRPRRTFPEVDSRGFDEDVFDEGFGEKWFLFACVLLNVVSESFCLRCYECFWSREKVDLKEYQEMFLARKTLAYPMVTAQKIIDTKKHPSTQEEFKRCATRTCSNSHWCLQWSYISNGNKDYFAGLLTRDLPLTAGLFQLSELLLEVGRLLGGFFFFAFNQKLASTSFQIYATMHLITVAACKTYGCMLLARCYKRLLENIPIRFVTLPVFKDTGCIICRIRTNLFRWCTISTLCLCWRKKGATAIFV